MVTLECMSSGAWVTYRQAREVLLMFREIGIISTLFLGGTALETMTPTGTTLHMTTICNIRPRKEDTTP